MQFAVDSGFTYQIENVALQFTGTARVQQLCFVIFVGQQFKVTQRPVGFSPGQWRHQVIDNHRLRAALGLRTFAGVVDDKRINVGHRPKDCVRPTVLRQPDALARQPFEIAVLTHMHHCMSAVGVTQPEIKRQISMRRHQIRIVIHRAGIDLIPPCRLNSDKGQAKTQTGNHHAPVPEHRILVRLTPTLGHRLPIGLGQGIKHRLVLIKPQTLQARTQIEVVQIVAYPTQQLRYQLGAAVWQRAIKRVTFHLQCPQDIQCCGWRVQTDAIANAAITGRVIGQNQGDALVCIGHPGQLDPAPRQFSDKIHAFRLRSIAHHVRLTALTAPGQILEADRAADDPPVQLRQRNVHGQVSGAEALLTVTPAGFVILSANGLNHRNIAPERTQVRRLRAGLRKAGGIQNDARVHLIQQVLDHGQTARFFEAGDSNWQGIESRCLQTLAKHIDKRGVGRLQVRAIEQHCGHGLPGQPVGLPMGELRAGMGRVVDRGTRQGLWFVPRIVTPQPLAGQAAIELQRVVPPALTQKMPKPFALFGRHGAQTAEFRVGAIIARYQNQRDAAFRQLHEALNAIAPVANATVQ